MEKDHLHFFCIFFQGELAFFFKNERMDREISLLLASSWLPARICTDRKLESGVKPGRNSTQGLKMGCERLNQQAKQPLHELDFFFLEAGGAFLIIIIKSFFNCDSQKAWNKSTWISPNSKSIHWYRCIYQFLRTHCVAPSQWAVQ